jgi:hypothetical protein
MNYLSFISILYFMTTITLVDFDHSSDLERWRVVDDGVMGGLSEGTFTVGEEGHGVFSGDVSLENNGGFSSVRHRTGIVDISSATKVILTVKGDGKQYQFRVRDDAGSYYSYITVFSTTGEWEDIDIDLSDMYASFRGRTLDIPNFSGKQIEEITFLIGNKKNESFKLLIDKIVLQ